MYARPNSGVEHDVRQCPLSFEELDRLGFVRREEADTTKTPEQQREHLIKRAAARYRKWLSSTINVDGARRANRRISTKFRPRSWR